MKERTPEEAAELIHELLLRFFRDKWKVWAWMRTENPLLGNITPSDMLHLGKHERLLKFIETQLLENK